jgi:type IV pilus assembly protein PilV
MLRNPRASSRQRGVGLIEVLIAVLVLAIGMLGIAAMQSITLKNSGSAAERTQAVIEVYAMLDILRANKSSVTTYNTAGYACAEGAASNQANDNLQGWLEQVRSNVAPSACGLVNCNASGACTVGVLWDDSRGTGDQGEPGAFEISTQL